MIQPKQKTLKDSIISKLMQADIHPMLKALAMGYIQKMSPEQVLAFAPSVNNLYSALCNSPLVVEAIKPFGVQLLDLKEIMSIFDT